MWILILLNNDPWHTNTKLFEHVGRASLPHKVNPINKMNSIMGTMSNFEMTTGKTWYAD